MVLCETLIVSMSDLLHWRTAATLIAWKVGLLSGLLVALACVLLLVIYAPLEIGVVSQSSETDKSQVGLAPEYSTSHAQGAVFS
jgi:hypothetical protein